MYRAAMNRAVFVDRDGTVVVDKAYLSTVDGIELLPRAGEALARLAADGFALVLATNQSGIGRGLFSRSIVAAQHERLATLLAPFGVVFADVAVCPHVPCDACSCRKPADGLLRTTAARLAIDLRASFMVGDKRSDVEAGRRAGCTTVFVGGSCAASDHSAPDLWQAAAWIASRPRSRGNEA